KPNKQHTPTTHPQPTKKRKGRRKFLSPVHVPSMVLEVDFPDSVPIIVARPFFFRVLDGGVPPLGVEAHVVNLRGHGGSEGDWQTAGLPECQRMSP
ncbi:MAG: hypothetical protein QF614_02950, partial [SAR324 cluster bacterium]|nr:hypothetical protein [SAR324 cluster bacterium]